MLFVMILSDHERSFVENLFRENKALFFNVARQILHSHAEAEDAVSDAMYRIIGWAGNMTMSNAALQGVLIAGSSDTEPSEETSEETSGE